MLKLFMLWKVLSLWAINKNIYKKGRIFSMENEIYVTPLSGRYASKEMNKIWSPSAKYSTWRKLWVALAETEKSWELILQMNK